MRWKVDVGAREGVGRCWRREERWDIWVGMSEALFWGGWAVSAEMFFFCSRSWVLWRMWVEGKAIKGEGEREG